MAVIHICWPVRGEDRLPKRLGVWIEADPRAAKGVAVGEPDSLADAMPDSGSDLEAGQGALVSPGSLCVRERSVFAELVAVLAGLDVADVEALEAWLPGTEGGVCGSQCGGVGLRGLTFRRVELACVWWRLDRAAGVLARMGSGSIRSSAGALRLGADVHFFRSAARFAEQIRLAERYTPALTGSNGTGCRAWWRALVEEPAIARGLTELAGQMPGSALLGSEVGCFGGPGEGMGGGLPGGASGSHRYPDAVWATTRLVLGLVDALVRSELPREEDELALEEGELLPIGPALQAALSAGELGRAEVLASQEDRARLLEGVRSWTSELFTRVGEVRLILELHSPDEVSELGDEVPDDPFDTGEGEGEGGWWLGFALGVSVDASVRVGAREVWNGTWRENALLVQSGQDAGALLLSELGRSARICPLLDEALQDRRPVGCWLSPVKAYDFLKHHAGVLQDAGVILRTPGWWAGDRSASRLSLRLEVSSAEGGGGAQVSQLSMGSLVRFDWKIALGDEQISRAEFDQLVQQKVPLVRIRGQWVELSSRQLKLIDTVLQKYDGKQGTLFDALQLGLAGPQLNEEAASEDELAELIGEGLLGPMQATGWIAPQLDALLAGDAARFESVASPVGFDGTLRPYQQVGVSWLVFLRRVGLGALLADDMGLGKTVQMLAALQHWRLEGTSGRVGGASAVEDAGEEAAAGLAGQNGAAASERVYGVRQSGPTLLVAPTSVVVNWRREAARFTPGLRVMVHQGAGRLRGASFREAALGSDLVLTSYALVHRDRQLFEDLEWSAIVLDEAQAVKNSAAKTSQAIRSLSARFRVALTGTPVENRLSELWSICDFLNPGYLGNYSRFRQRFVVPIERSRDAPSTRKLRRLLAPILLRRTKSDRSIITDLPEKIESTVFCKLTREQAGLYQTVVESSLSQIDNQQGIARKGSVLAAILRLKQICNHPRHYLRDEGEVEGRSGKLTRLSEMLDEILIDQDRALLFTQFTEFGTIVRDYLEQRFQQEVLFLHGGTPATLRDRMVQQFQAGVGPDGEQLGAAEGPQLFVLSLKAGGTGLNLTAANHVFHLDRWWNPAVEDQATDRAFRIGQKRTVQVHKFVCEGTLEERIDAMLEQKKALADSVMTVGEEWITQLSTEQLKDLFELRESALELD